MFSSNTSKTHCFMLFFNKYDLLIIQMNSVFIMVFLTTVIFFYRIPFDIPNPSSDLVTYTLVKRVIYFLKILFVKFCRSYWRYCAMCFKEMSCRSKRISHNLNIAHVSGKNPIGIWILFASLHALHQEINHFRLNPFCRT